MKPFAAILVALAALVIGFQALPSTGFSQSPCQTNPAPADPTNPDIVVSSPASGASVTSPITVTGQAILFEAVFNMALYNASGTEISTANGMSEEGSVMAPFTGTISFSVTADTPACLWVFAESAQDGSPQDVVQIPLTLKPSAGLPSTGTGPATPRSDWLLVMGLVAAGTLLTGAGFAARARART